MGTIYTAHYQENDYRLYLMHHGVPGMKWGVRRYQNYDGTLTNAGRKHLEGDKKGVASRMKIRAQGAINARKEMFENAKNAKGIVNKASELVGHGAAATKERNRSYTEQRLANASRTKFGQNLHNVRSENANYIAQFHDIKKGQSLKTRALETLVPTTALNTPMKTLSGRKTNIGREALLAATTGGIGNLALDAAYRSSKNRGGKYAKSSDKINNIMQKAHTEKAEKSLSNIDKRNEAKQAYKEQKRKLNTELWDGYEKIERKYKRGDTLSDKDVARERDLEAKIDKKWEANKSKYKAAMKKYR